MIRRLAILATIIAIGFAIKAWSDTMSDPVVRTATIVSGTMPANSQPVTIALLADIHVAGPDMPPARVDRIVAQVNALQPDLVAIAGDLVSEKRPATKFYSAEEIVAPLSVLSAPLGTVFVPGNHDHWFDWPALKHELDQIDNLTILANQAATFGPLAIGGVDDDFTGRADLAATIDAMAGMPGARIVLSHSPDVFPDLPADLDLVLAGHTHCGQIGYPWGGSPATMSEYGQKYACGLVEESDKTLITSAGIGTSLIPVRLFTQPEIWLITIQPPNP